MDIPPFTWFSAPAISEISKNKFSVLGRAIHLSQVHKLMQDATKGTFPIDQMTSSDDLFELTIRGDVVYVDNDVTFIGLRKIELFARKLISNGKFFIRFSAPKVCDEIDGLSCNFLSKASDGEDGKDGKSGIDSPNVDIYLHKLVGNVDVHVKASDGTAGQDGGDGIRGKDNNEESPPLKEEEACKDEHFNFDCAFWVYKGPENNPGPKGGQGGNGKRGGKSGNGGSVAEVKLFIVNISGEFFLRPIAGKGAHPAEHGHGGKGGNGGRGGCGIVCWCPTYGMYQLRSPPDPCEGRVQGKPGDPGLDGSLLYPTPEWGKDGIKEYASLNKVGKIRKIGVKSWFKDDMDLLRIIQRRGESQFLQNKRKEAHEIFAFLQSVTDEVSEIGQQASFFTNAITQGFDYYGNTENYAPDLDWFFLRDRVVTLLRSGTRFEQTYNEINNKVDQLQRMQNMKRFIVKETESVVELQLKHNKNMLKNRQRLFLNALKLLESRMEISMNEIETSVKNTIEKKSGQLPFRTIIEFIFALAGCASNAYASFQTGDILSMLKTAEYAKKTMEVLIKQQNKCKVPTIEEAFVTLEKRLIFGYEYKDLGPENLDFSKMDVSAVPVIMKSNLGRNKRKLAQELSCLLNGNNDLNILIEDFFADADLRITQIDRLMNINIKLQSIWHQLKALKETQDVVQAELESESSSEALSVKMQFTDLLFSLYQQQEAEIMSALYELSKAYQFVSLWNFDIMGKYVNSFGDRVMTDNLGSLNGIFHLHNIFKTIESERNFFLQAIDSSSGPASHTFNAFWSFNKDTDHVIFKSLNESDQFVMKLELDPNDIEFARCVNCYNGRLIAMYIELRSGESQEKEVPSTVYVRVNHLGDSSFLVPGGDGAENTVVRLQQTPQSVSGGNVMNFDLNKPIESKLDPALKDTFSKPGNKFCENVDKPSDFFGGCACKSPYATYTVVVPKGDHDCSLDPNNWIDGLNCKGLDLAKFDAVHVYARIKSWSSYVSQDHFEYSMRSQPTHQLCAVFKICRLMSFA
ncbi:uncharacterized protein LOC143449583 isoform X2 [Clavelina lepadiformis]